MKVVVAAVWVVLAGCSFEDYSISGKLGLLSGAYYPEKARIIAEVDGIDCVGQLGTARKDSQPYGDYRRAIDQALAKIPETNVLLDVAFYFEQRHPEVCRRVVGKAGILDGSTTKTKSQTPVCGKQGKCVSEDAFMTVPRLDGKFRVAANRIVPDQYAQIFDVRAEGRSCLRLTKTDKTNLIRKAFDDAMSKAPTEADALMMAEVYVEDAEEGFCFMVKGIPVKMKQ